jgi:hypothetical protein
VYAAGLLLLLLLQAAQPAQYTVPAGTQYVQYANYPPQ